MPIPPDKKDMYRAAHHLIKQHGKNAEDFALNTMQQFMDLEAVDAAGVWLCIAQAVAELQKVTPDDRTVH